MKQSKTQRNTGELWRWWVFSALVVEMVAGVYAQVHTHQHVYIKRVQLFGIPIIPQQSSILKKH